MFQPLLVTLVATATLAGVFACAPIEFGAAGLGVRDGGDLGPVMDLDSGGASVSDAGSGSTPVPSAGYRAACGVVSICAPDGTGLCETVLSSDAGAFVDAGDASATDAGVPSFDAGPADAEQGACRLSPTRTGTTCSQPGTGGAHASCRADEDCLAGFACAGGACEPLCCDERTRCAADGACILSPHSGHPERFVPVCAPRTPCAFTRPESCTNATQCGFSADVGSRVCVPLGPVRDGASCALAPCAAGFVCIGATNAERCARTCDPASHATCPVGQRCRVHPALFGTTEVGYCSPDT